jgi:hypothetical protein
MSTTLSLPFTLTAVWSLGLYNPGFRGRQRYSSRSSDWQHTGPLFKPGCCSQINFTSTDLLPHLQLPSLLQMDGPQTPRTPQHRRERNLEVLATPSPPSSSRRLRMLMGTLVVSSESELPPDLSTNQRIMVRRSGFSRGNQKGSGQERTPPPTSQGLASINPNMQQVPLSPGPGSAQPADSPAYEQPQPRSIPLFFREEYTNLIVKGNFMTLAARPQHVELGEWLAHQGELGERGGVNIRLTEYSCRAIPDVAGSSFHYNH